MRLLALAALLLCGCPLTHGDYPGRECADDTDCFKGQGERCNMTLRLCELSIDAGPDRPSIDRPPSDGLDTDGSDIPDGGLD